MSVPVCPARAGYGGRTDIGAYEYDTRSGGTATLAYDAAGDLTADGDKVYHYDALGRLTYVASGANTNVALASYRYDALGRLAMRITHDYQQADTDLYDPADTTRYYYYDTPPTSNSTADGGRQILPQVIEVTDGTATTDQYVWGPSYVDELIAHDRDTDADGSLDTLQLAVHDRQFSTLAIVDPDGELEQSYRYNPYGADPTDPRSGVAMLTGAEGQLLSAADLATDVLYTGRHYDPVIGENNHRRRYLSHNFGRWLQADPLGVEVAVTYIDGRRRPMVSWTSDVSSQYGDGSNLAACLSGKPMRNVDPSGKAVVAIAITTVTVAKACSHGIMAAYYCYLANECSFREAAQARWAHTAYEESLDRIRVEDSGYSERFFTAQARYRDALEAAAYGEPCGEMRARCAKHGVKMVVWLSGRYLALRATIVVR